MSFIFSSPVNSLAIIIYMTVIKSIPNKTLLHIRLKDKHYYILHASISDTAAEINQLSKMHNSALHIPISQVNQQAISINFRTRIGLRCYLQPSKSS